jgi:4-hydroxy-2-oxoheptanedioate aldolase
VHLNKVKQALLDGRPVVGAAACLCSPLSAELMALAGLDYVLVDDQHGIWEPATLMAAFRSIWAGGAVPMARVGKNDYYAIGAMLDRGALGIIVPMVNSAAEAEAAVFAARYPPLGGRSIGAYGCHLYGPDYVALANDEVFLAVQIETGQALDRAEEILAVEGVDGCWVGPMDLARSMGLDLNRPDHVGVHREAILRVLAACQATGKIPGLWCAPEELTFWRDQGFLFLTPAADRVYVDHMTRMILQGFR